MKANKELKGVAEEDALRKLLNSESEDEEDEEKKKEVRNFYFILIKIQVVVEGLVCSCRLLISVAGVLMDT